MSKNQRIAPTHQHPGDVYPDKQSPESYASNEWNNLINYFGMPNSREISPSDMRRITVTTLKEWFEGVNPKLTMITRMQMTQVQGWWSRFAPLQTVERNQQIMVETWENVALEPTPEEVPPSLISFSKHTHYFSLKKFSLGAHFLIDYYKTEEGVRTLQKAIQQLISASWITMNLSVTQAIFNSNQYWANRQRMLGKTYSDITSAKRAELDGFGILNRTSKGLYKMCAAVDEVTMEENVTTDMAVFPPGTLTKIAMNHFESEPQRRGPQGLLNLSLGGKALENGVVNKTLYEDKKWNVPNISLAPIDQLSTRTQIGEYFIMDDRALDVVEPGSVDVEKVIAIQVPTMQGNRWTTLSVRQALDNCCRYDSDGRPMEDVQDLANNLQAWQQKTGLEVQGGRVDPFLWRADQSNLTNGGYKQIKYWGDIEPAYWPMKKVLRNASWARARVLQNLTIEDMNNINKLKILRDTLALPPGITTPEIQAFVFAVAAQNKDDTSNFLAGNTEASVDLPTRTVGGGGTITTNGVERTILIAMGGAVTATAALNHSKAGTEISAFAATAVAPDGGVAAALRNRLPIDGNPVQPDAWALARFPDRPYGYTTFPHFRYLAKLHQNGTYRGWNPEIFQTAFNGVRSLEKMMRIQKAIFGLAGNVFFDVKNVPVYMKTGDDEIDSIALAVTSLWSSEVSYPFLTRAVNTNNGDPADARDRGTGDMFVNVNAKPNAEGAPTGPNPLSDRINEVRIALGLTDDFFGEADVITQLGVLGEDQEGILTKFYNDAVSRETEGESRENIFKNEGAKIAQNWRNPRFHLGTDFSNYIAAKYPTSPDTTSFAYYYLDQIAPIVDENQRAALFGAAIRLAMNEGIRSLTPKFKDSVLASYKSNASKRRVRHAAELIDAADEVQTKKDTSQWVNTRLVFSNRLWNSELLNLKKGDDAIRAFYRSIIRPADPRNIALPLLEDTVTTSADLVIPDDSVTPEEELEFARLSFNFQRSSFGLFDNVPQRDFKRTQAESDSIKKMGDYGVFDKKRLRGEFIGPIFNPFTDMLKLQDGSEVIVDRVNLKGRLEALELQCASDDLLRICAQLMCGVEDSRQAQDATLNQNVPIPMLNFAFVIAFITLRMGCAIFAKGGSETAIIGHNYESAILQLNGATGKWLLNFSMWIGVVIIDETKFVVVPNVVFQEYISGYDTTFYNSQDQFNALNPDYKRSMFCFAIGDQDRETVPNPLTLQFKSTARHFDQKFSNPVFSNTPMLDSGLFYSMFWGFSELNSNSNVDRTNSTYIDDLESMKINDVCWSGPIQRWSHPNRDYSTLELGTGHVGDILPPKALSIFNGDFLSEIPTTQWLA